MKNHPASPPPTGDPVPQILRDWLRELRMRFTAPSWEYVLVPVMGAVLAPGKRTGQAHRASAPGKRTGQAHRASAPGKRTGQAHRASALGKRTVSACLRMTGRAGAKTFSSYHQFLNRARWNPHVMARHLPGMVVNRLMPDGPVVIAIDDAIERRWGRRITARGIHRDPIRSSHGHFVKAGGLRRLSFMVLTPVPWAGVVKALPVLTLLAPSQRSNLQRGRRHKLLTDRARLRCLILGFDGAISSSELKDALWARYCTEAPRRRGSSG